MDRLLKGLMGLCSGITCLVLLMIIGYILYRGILSLTWNLLSTEPNNLTGNIGILPNILNIAVYHFFVAMIIVLPLGVGAAIYLTEYSSPEADQSDQFCRGDSDGHPIHPVWTGGHADFHSDWRPQARYSGRRADPGADGAADHYQQYEGEFAADGSRSYREGALALGSGKWHMIRTVVLPSALDGIITGCILSVGRITSESAALLFTAGFGLKMIGFVQALQSSSATLTVALYIYASERGAYDIAFAIAIVLMALTLALNLIASKTAKKIQEKRG